MILPTDITKEAVVADIKANGPSLIKDITRRVLGLSPSATRGITITYAKHYERVYGLLQTLRKTGVVATRVLDGYRSKNERRGLYFIPDRGENGADVAPPIGTQPSGPRTNVVVSGGGVFATRQDGVVFRYAPVSGDPNGEWEWQRLPDVPQD